MLGLRDESRRVLFEQNARETVDRPQRGAQVMRDGVTERIQLLVRGFKGDTVLLDFLFRPLALRDVAEDAGKEGVTAGLPACERKFQGELGPLFSLPHQLDRPPNHMGFSRRKKSRKPLSVCIVEPLRHEERERPADYV